jgi:methylmalonyl-CoA/ethylmalonyl-CoA epimerase
MNSLENLKKSLGPVVLDHIAIAVTSLDQGMLFWQQLGLTFEPHQEIVESQKVKTAFAPIDQNAHLELLEPTHESSPIAQFIQKKGEGLHHLCFRVADVKAKQTELSALGFKFIYTEPQPGAGGCLVNFIHPKSTGGVLVEISTGRHV